MIDEKLIQYKQSLTSPYTGMIEELRDKIDGIKIDKKENYDLNKNGQFDKDDSSIAGKVLQQSKKLKKVK